MCGKVGESKLFPSCIFALNMVRIFLEVSFAYHSLEMFDLSMDNKNTAV